MTQAELDYEVQKALMGFSFKNIGKAIGKVAKAANPIKVTKDVFKTAVKAANPLTAFKIAKTMVKNPKKGLKALAQLDPVSQVARKTLKRAGVSKKVLNAIDPLNVTAKATKGIIRAANPLTTLKMARDIIKDPMNIKRNIGKLATFDPGINAGVSMYRDMKRPATKPKAVAAYKQAVAKVATGDPQAKKVVGTIKQLARSEIEAPEVPDSELNPETAMMQPARLQPARLPTKPSRPVQPRYDEPEEEEETEEMETEAYDEPDSYDEPEEEEEEENGMEDMSEVEGEALLGGLVTVGFNFGSILKSAVDTVKKIAPTAMAVAKLTPYGAAISTAANVVSKVAPGITKGMGLLDAAKKGDPVASGKIQQVQALAKSGNPQGKAALETLKQAREVHNAAVIASGTLKPPATMPAAFTPAAASPASASTSLPAGAGAPVVVHIHMTPEQAAQTRVEQRGGSGFFSAGLFS